MGYTHYWFRPKELEADKFSLFSQRVLFILSHLPETTATAGGYFKNHPLKVVGESEDESAKLTPEIVFFNGGGQTPDTREDLSHEGFEIERVFKPEDWQVPKWAGRYCTFCKTARKPYDLAVGLALIAFREVFGEAVIVSSDGQESDWVEAFTLYNQLFGTQLKFEDVVFPKPAPDEPPPPPDFVADQSAPIGSRRWRIKNGIADTWAITETGGGAWVAESPPFQMAGGGMGKLVKSADASGNGKMFPVVTVKPTTAPPPTQTNMIPETIQSIIAQMGGRGLTGALVYIGTSQLGYKCPDPEGECRSGYRSKETETGAIDYDVGLAFKVNGKPTQNWTMVVAYEPDDTYSVWLWRRAKPTEAKAGKAGVVLDHLSDVYCDMLKMVVERMYDKAIKEHNDSFIPC